MSEAVAVVLAAGQGKRMKSDLPKVLHEACGRPMIEYVLDAARDAGARQIIVVVGHRADEVKSRLACHPDVSFAVQTEQLGTGHAVKMCREHLATHNGPVVVLAGDTPLVRSESIRALLDSQQGEDAACVVGTAITQNNFGLGRIVRDPIGEFLRIVEEKDASPDERQITEINTGCFAFDTQALLKALGGIGRSNSQGEEYLTDCAEILRQSGRRVVALNAFDISEALGVNTPEQLAEVERVMRWRS